MGQTSKIKLHWRAVANPESYGEISQYQATLADRTLLVHRSYSPRYRGEWFTGVICGIKIRLEYSDSFIDAMRAAERLARI